MQTRLRTLLALAAAAVVLSPSVQRLTAYSTFARWADTTIYFYVNPVNGDVADSSATAALQTALAEWSTNSGTPFRYVYGGRVSDTSTGYDARNVALFRNATATSGSSTIATTYWWTSGGTIVDADIVFWDGAWTFSTGTTGCSSGAYIEDAAVHELGHALGLNHSSVADASMYSTYSRCSQDMRTLAADDIAGAQSLYGASSSQPSTINTAPVVSITAPGNNASFAKGATVAFSGTASDSQDGTLTASLVWTSSLDGPIGSGGSFGRTLSAGTHTIRASATDTSGLTATNQITITIVDATATTTATVPALSVRAYKVKGSQKADLNWSGLSSASVDIFRNAVRVDTTSNDGGQTDAINKKGGGAYTYQVCAAGTSTCSNQATIVF